MCHTKPHPYHGAGDEVYVRYVITRTAIKSVRGQYNNEILSLPHRTVSNDLLVKHEPSSTQLQKGKPTNPGVERNQTTSRQDSIKNTNNIPPSRAPAPITNKIALLHSCSFILPRLQLIFFSNNE